MSETLYPYGYGTGLATMAQLEARYGPGAPIPPHPAYWRRIKAWLESKGGKIGIGGAFRFVQPDKEGFAPPGMSFHEKQRYASGFEGYAAIDLVVRNGSERHRAPTWSEVPRQGSGHPDIKTFGLHCNVSGEPWHIQCFEMDGYVSWRDAGRKDPNINFDLPGGGTPPPPPPPPATNYHPAPQPTLKQGSSGNEVKELQNLCNFWGWGDVGKADGQYGPRTKTGVYAMQTALKIGKDGVYGPQSAAALQKFLKDMEALANKPDDGTYKLGERTLRVQTPKMRGNDVTWVQQTLKKQGLTITVDGWYGGETRQRVMTMQGWNGLTRDGVVGPKTWEILKKY